MSVVSVMPSNHLILCHPLLLPPSIFPSIGDFSNESVLCIRWPKYWSLSFSISPSNEYSGLISFRIDWLALLAVQGTLKSLLQHHSSKASILREAGLPESKGPCCSRGPCGSSRISALCPSHRALPQDPFVFPEAAIPSLSKPSMPAPTPALPEPFLPCPQVSTSMFKQNWLPPPTHITRCAETQS